MNFLPAVPARHVAAFFAKVKAQGRVLGTGLSARPRRGPSGIFACQTINHLQARTPALPTDNTSVLRLFPLRRSCAKAGVLRSVPLSARDELVPRMKSEIVLQFRPELIKNQFFWVGPVMPATRDTDAVRLCCYAESRIEHRVELLSEKAIL